MDLVDVAQRLDAEEKLKLKYRYLVRHGAIGEHTEVVREDRLLDVEPEKDVFFVSFDDRDVIWIKADEAIDVLPDDGIYGETAGH